MIEGENAGISALEMPAPRVIAVLRLISAALMFSMMSVTFVDVVGRYLLSLPLPGSSEIGQVLMASIVALSIPMVSEQHQHVKMALFVSALGGKARRILDAAVFFGSALVLIFIAVLLWRQASTLREMNTTTIFLQLPMAPSAYALSVFTGATALIEFWYGRLVLIGASERP